MKTPQRARKTSMHTREIPRDVKNLFKAWCGRRGYTMQAATIELMKKAARDNIALPKARK